MSVILPSAIFVYILVVAQGYDLSNLVNIPNAGEFPSNIGNDAGNIHSDIGNMFGGGDDSDIESLFNGIGDTADDDAADAANAIKNLINEVINEDSDDVGDESNDDITTLEEFLNAIGEYDSYDDATTNSDIDNIDLEEFVKNWGNEEETKGQELSCFQCKSADDLSCNNKDELNQFLQKCPTHEKYCQTLTMKMANHDETSYIRKCGGENLNMDMDCKNQNLTACISYASCNTDGCNGNIGVVNNTGKLAINHVASVLGLFFAILFMR